MKKTFKSKFRFNTRTLYAYTDPNKRSYGNEDTSPTVTTLTGAIVLKA